MGRNSPFRDANRRRDEAGRNMVNEHGKQWAQRVQGSNYNTEYNQSVGCITRLFWVFRSVVGSAIVFGLLGFIIADQGGYNTEEYASIGAAIGMVLGFFQGVSRKD